MHAHTHTCTLYITHTHITTTQVIFVMTPGIQEREHQLLDMFLSHPLAGDQFSRALMKSYIGMSSHD